MVASCVAEAVKVSVVHADRRVDVALPTSVPLVEYLPEVTRSLGLDGPARWQRLGAGVLDPGHGLGGQGVCDGDVLVALPADDPARLTRFDDLGEAVRVVTAAEYPRWRAACSAAALGVVAALATGAVAPLLPPLGRGATVAVALPTALLVLLVAGVRARGVGTGVAQEVVAVAVAAPHALVAGLALVPPATTAVDRAWWLPETASSWAGAGAGLVVLGALAGGCLRQARWAAVVPTLVGLGWVGGACVARLLSVEPGALVMLVAAAAVLVGRVVPGAVLEATVVRGDRDRPGAVDLDRVRGDLRLAHALVACGGLVQGVLLLSAVPYAVGRGLPAATWVALLVLLLALRCRHEVLRDHVVLQASCAAACWLWLLVTAVLRPDGVPVALGALALTGLVAAASRGLSPRSSPRLAWCLDGAERLLVLAVLPGWVVVAGGVPGWPGWS